ENLQKLIDFSAGYDTQPNVTLQRLNTYICPSDPNVKERPDGLLTHYPINYGVNVGTWFAFDPVTGRTGDGAFGINARFRIADIADGTSNTLAASEVKSFTNYKRNSNTVT